MEKKLEDYLHFYLWCECEITWIDPKYEFHEMTEKDKSIWHIGAVGPFTPYMLWLCSLSRMKVRFHLRHLSDITEQEVIELFKEVSLIDLSNCVFDYHNDEDGVWCNAEYEGRVIDAISIIGDGVEMMNNNHSFSMLNPQSAGFRFFLSKQFDLFNLIESDLAINKASLNK